MDYKCKKCGNIHDDFPSLCFNAPYHYATLTENEKSDIAELSSDFCIIRDENQIDRFIRVVLIQKINDVCQDLEYGLWVSLSEKSYNDYKKNFHNQNHEVIYFGWLCSQIPEYKSTLSIKTNVCTQKDNSRPIIEIQTSNDYSNPFIKDYFEGISKQEATRRINNMLNNNK